MLIFRYTANNFLNYDNFFIVMKRFQTNIFENMSIKGGEVIFTT